MGQPHCFLEKAQNSLNFSKTRFLFFKKKTHLKREKSSMKVKLYLAPTNEGRLI
jgi:hypothetical protein